jgi:phosphoribosylanthranilate isomerase
MEIKVCGMREADNIRDLIQLPIDYMGFIFYEKSARYVSLKPELKENKRFQDIKKVGVFVNANIDFVLQKIKEFDLKAVQLHGKETPQYIKELKVKQGRLKINELKTYKSLLEVETSKLENKKSDLTNFEQKLDTIELQLERIHLTFQLEIWKVFSIDDSFNFKETEPYEQVADKFLFDTKTPQHGGSGQKFNWDLLNNYTGQIPFFLSGGISAADTEEVKNIQHPQFYGLDLNSKFEVSPALKDTRMLHKFLFSLGLL